MPPASLVMTVGAAGSGKTTFLRRVPPALVISPDQIRYELSGDASDQRHEARVWRIVQARLHDRLARGLATVLDSTASTPSVRRMGVKAARRHGAPVLLLVFDVPLGVCLERNRARVDPLRSSPVPDEVIRRQHARVVRLLANPRASGADRVVVLGPGEAEQPELELPRGSRLRSSNTPTVTLTLDSSVE